MATFMRGSCHLDRSSNVKIGVEYKIIFVVAFFSAVIKCFLGHLKDLEKVGDSITKIAEQFVFLYNPAKHKKVNKHFKI